MPVTSIIVAAAMAAGITAYTTDGALMNLVQHNRSGFATGLAGVGRRFGEPSWVWRGSAAAMVGGYLIKQERLARAGRYAVESIALADLTSIGIKVAFHRHRPHLGDGPYVWDGPSVAIDDPRLSFSSGHAANAFAMATAIHEVWGEIPGVTPAAYTLAALTGWSRMYDRMHWASDVIAGALVGWGSARVAIALDQRVAAGMRVSLAPTGTGLALTARW